MPIPSIIESHLEKKGGNRVTKLLTAYALYEALKPIYDTTKEKWKIKHHKKWYQIKVNDKDIVYPFICDWVVKNLPEDAHAPMLVETGHERNRAILFFSYDSRATNTLELDGHRIKVSKGDPQKNIGDTSNPISSIAGSQNSVENFLNDELVFWAETPEGRQALLDLITKLAQEFYDREYAVLKTPSSYGGWNYNKELPRRDINSVILKEGQREGIMTDLRTFLNNEQMYVNMGMPYHRGYIFYGPPGTGKTSAARALANEFSLPVHYLPLGSMHKDTDLITAINGINPRSMLLLEDVDVYISMTEREQETNNVSMSAILNTLDGVYTPHGLITIMTTNNIDALDDAIVRPGRIDIKEKFDNLDNYQVNKIIEYMDVPGDYSQYVGESPAALIEAIKKVKLN